MYFEQARLFADMRRGKEIQSGKLHDWGMASVLVSDFRVGINRNGPERSVEFDKKNGIYYTDPYYQRDYWERKKPDSAPCGTS
jgi:hypothetical protein